MKEKIKKYYPIFIIILIILGVVFYWYEWRPTQIKKECSMEAYDSSITSPRRPWESPDDYYKKCLRENGL